MTINYSTIDNLCRQVELLNQDELSILLSKLDRTSRDRLQTEIFDSLSQNTNNGIEYCPYCGGIRINKKGKAHGTQRYICRDCNKTFTSTKNSIFYHFRKDYEPKFKKFIECMVNRLTLIRSAEISGITLMCSWNWRHKIMNVIDKFFENDQLTGLIEMDETFFSKCFKGNHKHFQLPRKARHRGFSHWVCDPAGIGKHKVCVSTSVGRNKGVLNHILGCGNPNSELIVNAYKNKIIKTEQTKLIIDGAGWSCLAAKQMNIQYKQLVKKGKNPNDHSPVVKGKYHLQNVNNYHSQIKGLLNQTFKGVATKYLERYLNLVKWLRINNNGFNVSVQAMLTMCVTVSRNMINTQIRTMNILTLN